MFPLKTFAAAFCLFCLAITGFVYGLSRPKPKIESIQPEPVGAVEQAPSPEPSVVKTEPETQTKIITLEFRQPPAIKSFSVSLVQPAMATTLVAPGSIKLAAHATPSKGLEKIEFFNGPLNDSVCLSLERPEEFPGTKIGETTSAPYDFQWSEIEAGTYGVFAVATYSSGDKQTSQPSVVVVNPKEDYSTKDWVGWRPDYVDKYAGKDLSIAPAPTPNPRIEDCPSITVKRLDQTTGLTDPLTFTAEIAGQDLPNGLVYKWSVSGGHYLSGENTQTVTVTGVNRLFDKQVTVSVEIRGLKTVCTQTMSEVIKFPQPAWLTDEDRSVLLSYRYNLGALVELNRGNVEVFIFLRGDEESCVDSDLMKEAKLLRRYLVDVEHLKNQKVSIRNGGAIEEDDNSGPRIDIGFKTGATDEEGLLDNIKLSARRSLRTCNAFTSTPVKYGPRNTLNRACPDVADPISYKTTLRASQSEINTCPYNEKDPQNTETQIVLYSRIAAGIFGNEATFDYWVNGGDVRGGISGAIWDLSRIKLKPGIYTAIAKSDDGCACPSVSVETVAVRNFCTPCLTVRRWCEGSKQGFVADVQDFTVGQAAARFFWTTSKGRIVDGGGTSRITLDTSRLMEGEEYEVSVRVGGLLRYCENHLTTVATVGPCPPTPPKVDTFDQLSSAKRRARRQSMEPVVTSSESVDDDGAAEGPPTTSEGSSKPNTNEKEWMKVSWAPRVMTDESFPITVTYNRTTESVQVSNAPGELVEELNLGKQFRSLKERFGPAYETFAAAKLVVAGIDCNSCNQDQYQSLDAEKVEWSWPVSPARKGTLVFNVELWAKAELRDKNSGKQSINAEKVWSRTNLKVDVTEPILTKTTVFAGGGLFAVVGLGLCFRGMKIYRIGDTYNVGQAVAVGRNVTMNNTTVNQGKNDQGGNNNAG